MSRSVAPNSEEAIVFLRAMLLAHKEILLTKGESPRALKRGTNDVEETTIYGYNDVTEAEIFDIITLILDEEDFERFTTFGHYSNIFKCSLLGGAVIDVAAHVASDWVYDPYVRIHLMSTLPDA